MFYMNDVARYADSTRHLLRLRPAKGLPEQIHVSITDRCSLPCRMCDIWRIKPGEELTTSEWKNVFDQVAHWAGAVSLNFAGGEPFLRKDLPDLIRHAKGIGFTVTSNTNATAFTERRVEEIAEAGLDVLYVSLDGTEAKTHDYMRGQDGTYEKAMRALDWFGKVPNPRIIVACIIHRRNIEQIPVMAKWTESRGYQVVYQPLFSTFGRNYDPNWYLKSDSFPREDQLPQLDEALDGLIRIKEADGHVCNSVGQLREMKRYFRDPSVSNGLPCNAGHSDISLDPYGNFLLCFWLPPVGDVRRTPIPWMWNSIRSQRRRWEAHNCPRTCNMLNCNFEHM
jgi:MoaA/NifB/PqqE/SkfB family radical SAM enzyme